MYVLYAPNAFCFREALEKKYKPNYVKKQLWKYHHLFSLVLDKIEARGCDTTRVSAFVSISMGELDRALGNTEINKVSVRCPKRILDDLVEWGVVLREHLNKHKELGGGMYQHSTQVRVKIKDEVMEQGFTEWVASAAVKPSPLTGFAKQYKVLTGIYKQLEDNLALIEFDAVGARAFALQCYKQRFRLRDKRRGNILVRDRVLTYSLYQGWLRTITSMERRHYRATSDEHKTGRFFSLLSNLPSPLRRFITIGGQALVEVDIASSQCLVFAIYLKQQYAGSVMPVDVTNYIKLCEAGQFYPCIKPLVMGYEKEMDMHAFKSTFFGRVFFSSEKVNYQWRARFNTYFPNVGAAITAFKSESYKDLPEKLSYLESEIMLHRITPRLFAEGINTQFSVHDSFFCTPDVRADIERILVEEFAHYGVKPFIKDKTTVVVPAYADLPAPLDFDLGDLEVTVADECDAIW